MTGAVLGSGVRRDRSLRTGAAVGALATAGLLLLGALLTSSSGPSRPAGGDGADVRRAALLDWEAAVHPLVLSGGQVVALGPRAGVGQIERRELAAADLRQMAGGWVRRLTTLEGEVAAVQTPDFLRPAHALLTEAMRGYVTASRHLLAATTATGVRRSRLLTAAAAAGMAADRTYDRATAAIARWRAELALPVDWSG